MKISSSQTVGERKYLPFVNFGANYAGLKYIVNGFFQKKNRIISKKTAPHNPFSQAQILKYCH